MDPEEFERPGKGSLPAQLAAEDIDALSVDELQARIVLLKNEIKRSEARLEFASRHKASADALFKK